MSSSLAAPSRAPRADPAPAPAAARGRHPLLRELRGRPAESGAMILLCLASLALLLTAYLAVAPERLADAAFPLFLFGLWLPYFFGLSVAFWRFRFRRIGAVWGFLLSTALGPLLASLADRLFPGHSLLAFVVGWWLLLSAAGYMTGIGLPALPRAAARLARRAWTRAARAAGR